jgi:hypothetical protein
MGNLLRAYRHWRRLPAPDRGDAVVAAALLPVFWLAVRIPGFPVLRRPPGGPEPQAMDAAEAERARALGRIVNAAALRAFGPGQCLTRSLALQWMLRRRGIASQLRIGVRRDGAGLSAHAWIEYAGLPVNDGESVGTDYAVFTESLRFADFER